MAPLAVGIAGAGPWASLVHGPVLAAGPETEVAGVWSRTEASAAKVAAAHGVPVCRSFDELLECCDAVALVVPPVVQPVLAVAAARAGKAVLLEKPLGADVVEAARVADAVGEAGVGSLVVLTYRFASIVRDFLAAARDFPVTGARGCFLSGAFLGGPFAAPPWRAEAGALLDVGPHILDLIDAAAGPVVAIEGRGDPHGFMAFVLEHENGAVSDVSLSCRVGDERSRTEVELFGPEGALTVDARAAARAESFATLRAEFAAVARTGGPHECDVQRGLHVQKLVEMAQAALGR